MIRLNKFGASSHKFRAIPVVIDGIRFPSKLESKHYLELRMREKFKDIKELKVHPKYLICEGNGIEIYYEADFEFIETMNDKKRVVDSKGVDTPASKLKRKMFKAKYGFDVEIWP